MDTQFSPLHQPAPWPVTRKLQVVDGADGFQAVAYDLQPGVPIGEYGDLARVGAICLRLCRFDSGKVTASFLVGYRGDYHGPPS